MQLKEANLTILVKDLDRSVEFYQTLGLTLKNRWGNHYAQLSAPGITIGLHPAEEINQLSGSGNTSIGFTAGSLEEAKPVLEKLEVTVQERNEAGGKFLHFQDPDGTSLYFIEPKW